MSQEYYVGCDECKKKVHLGGAGFSGFQCWTGEEKTMKKLRNLLEGCMLHFEKLTFFWEQTEKDDNYEEVK